MNQDATRHSKPQFLPGKTSRKSKVTLAITASIIVLFAVIGSYAIYDHEKNGLPRRVDNGFSELSLPLSMQQVAVQNRKEDGDIVTGTRAAQVRTYSSSLSLQETQDELYQMLLAEAELGVDWESSRDDDVRISMHPEGDDYLVDNSRKTCSPALLPLKSDTYATVIFSDTREGAAVALDDDLKVENLKGYIRKSCESTTGQSYVTLVIWAM